MTMCEARDIPASADQPATALLRTDRADDLWRIRDPDVALVLWQREPVPGLAAWLAALPARRLPDTRVLVTEATLSPALTQACDDADMPGGPFRRAFLADAMRLARLFLDVMDAATVDVRLNVIRHDACWRFHRDYVPARMLTTYRGAATQWVTPANAADALAAQRAYAGPIERFPDHAVGLFKGERAIASLTGDLAVAGQGIVHRSPPIAGTGETRLLLCLNLPSETSPAAWSAPRRR